MENNKMYRTWQTGAVCVMIVVLSFDSSALYSVPLKALTEFLGYRIFSI